MKNKKSVLCGVEFFSHQRHFSRQKTLFFFFQIILVNGVNFAGVPLRFCQDDGMSLGFNSAALLS